jgi:uncharacterized repeat protein (TIGR01451 family)
VRNARRLICLLLLLSACDGSTTGPENAFEERSVVISPTSSVVLSSADGAASVTIPPGAVSEPTRITIRELRPDEVPGPIALRSPLGRVWQLGPEGLQLQLLVEVRLAFDTDDLPPGVSVSDLTMITLDLDGAAEELQAVTVDAAASASSGLRLSAASGIRGLISHFSPFAIVVLDVHKRARSEFLSLGEPAVFDVEIRNRGSTPLTGVVLTDSLDFVFRASGAEIRPEDITINRAAFPDATVTIRADSLSFTVDLGTLAPDQTSFVPVYSVSVLGRIAAQHCNQVVLRSSGAVIGEDGACVVYGF